MRARLNFQRRPILCTTLYRNLMQASNFGGTFDQLFLWIFLLNFHKRCLLTSSIPRYKKVKNDQKLKSRGLKEDTRKSLYEGLLVVSSPNYHPSLRSFKTPRTSFSRTLPPLAQYSSELNRAEVLGYRSGRADADMMANALGLGAVSFGARAITETWWKIQSGHMSLRLAE